MKKLLLIALVLLSLNSFAQEDVTEIKDVTINGELYERRCSINTKGEEYEFSLQPAMQEGKDIYVRYLTDEGVDKFRNMINERFDVKITRKYYIQKGVMYFSTNKGDFTNTLYIKKITDNTYSVLFIRINVFQLLSYHIDLSDDRL